MTNYKGFSIEIKSAFTGFYADITEPTNEWDMISQPGDTDQTIPAAQAYGFDTQESAIKEAKRKISVLLNRLGQNSI